MTQPTEWNNGTIKGVFLNDDYSPFIGSAIIHAAVSAIREYGQAVVKIADRTVPLAAGAFSQSMPSSTDPDISPQDWTYTVTIVGPANAKSTYPPFTFKLDVGATVDLTEVTIVAPAPGLPNIVGGGGGGGGPAAWDTLTGKPTVVAAGATAADARGAIDAGTSNVTIGTTAGTAKDATVHDAWTEVTNKPLTFVPAAHTHALSDIAGTTSFGQTMLSAASASAGQTALGFSSVGKTLVTAVDLPSLLSYLGIADQTSAIATLTAQLSTTPVYLSTLGGVYPPRPATPRPVVFTDPAVQPSNDGSTSGGGGMASIDFWWG